MYDRIRALREDKDLKQRELAHELSIGQTTYSYYELGKLNIPIPILIKLAYYHDVSIDYLVGITDDPSHKPWKK